MWFVDIKKRYNRIRFSQNAELNEMLPSRLPYLRTKYKLRILAALKHL